MQSVQSFLQDLLDRASANALDADDVFAISMVAMLMKKQKTHLSNTDDDKEALRCLALGWFVNSMMTSHEEIHKSDK